MEKYALVSLIGYWILSFSASLFWCFRGIKYLGYEIKRPLFDSCGWAVIRCLMDYALLKIPFSIINYSLLSNLPFPFPIPKLIAILFILLTFGVRYYIEWWILYVLLRYSYKKNIVYPEYQSFSRIHKWIINGTALSVIAFVFSGLLFFIAAFVDYGIRSLKYNY
jgi:hypothetical protein